MVKAKRSVPFSISILTLMALIVVPLASALLWLGWRAVDKLEQRDGATRLAALDDAVSVFLTNDLHTIVSVGLTLAEVTSFASQAGPAADDDRGRHLVAVLQQHPVPTAISSSPGIWRRFRRPSAWNTARPGVTRRLSGSSMARARRGAKPGGSKAPMAAAAR